MVQPLPAMSMYGPLLGYCYQSKNPCSYWAGPEGVATSYGMKLAGVGTTRCPPRHMKRPTDKRAARIRYRSQRPKNFGPKKNPRPFPVRGSNFIPYEVTRRYLPRLRLPDSRLQHRPVTGQLRTSLRMPRLMREPIRHRPPYSAT